MRLGWRTGREHAAWRRALRAALRRFCALARGTASRAHSSAGRAARARGAAASPTAGSGCGQR
eukprot:2383254-Prymnesium_polylepis.2